MCGQDSRSRRSLSAKSRTVFSFNEDVDPATTEEGAILSRLLAILAVLASLLAVAPHAAYAANFEVTNCDDAGAGSLRQAILDANTDGTATALDPHVITFNLACATITLTTGQLTITNYVDIQGPGAAVLAISGNDASRVFEVESGASLTISDVTITGGRTDQEHGAGILNDGGFLTVSRVVFTGNLVLGDNHITSSGGGIACVGGLLGINDSTFDTNEARTGGGVFLFTGATATIAGSTFVNNTARDAGGGIINVDSTLTVTNSTVSGNSGSLSTGGIWTGFASGSTTLLSSTVTGNETASEAGANLRVNSGSITLSGTIVSDGIGPANCDTLSGGAITSQGYNLEDTDTCGLNVALDDIPNGNPDLGPLADNGGPTWTHALGANSDAIDHIPADGSAGCGTTVTTDQRGAARPQNGLCDIGAYEVFVQTYYQACLYAGSLTQVRFIGNVAPPINCGRGEPVILLEAGDPQYGVLYACLYAGSLSQVGWTEPTNCGRGVPITLATGDDLQGCLYAGRLSQLGYSAPSSCGRGEPIGLALAIN